MRGSSFQQAIPFHKQTLSGIKLNNFNIESVTLKAILCFTNIDLTSILLNKHLHVYQM